MKNNIVKFLIRLSVVVLGVLISFSIEKKRALSYKEDLKNTSLRKMIGNIEHDKADNTINYKEHTIICKYAKRLLSASDELFANNRDSLGYYLNAVIKGQTIFMDNKEEYLTLRNSGLLALIDNDSLVSLLQKKYSLQSFYNKMDEIQLHMLHETTMALAPKTSANVIGRTLTTGFYGTYIDKNPLTNTDLILILEKYEISEALIGISKTNLHQDSILIELINQELINTE